MDITLALILILGASVITWLATRLILTGKSRKELSEIQDRLAQQQLETAKKDALLAAAEQSRKELKESQEKAMQALKAEVTAETEKVLKEREEQLSKSNKTSMDSILNPLKESISQMQKAMSDNAKEHIRSTTELKEKFDQAVKEMGQKTSDIGAKADELATALTGRPKVQGCWGENLLEDILSREGLVNGIHYEREVANTDRSRPDFVFHFKEGLEEKDLVVDSKVSLTAFVRYMNEEDEQKKNAALQEHLSSVRKHIEELAKKDYAAKVDKNRRFADYVLMFMPVDAAYRVAIDYDPMLWQDAYEKGILIATEQTIMPFLKIIKLTWNKYQQDSNIQEITKAAEAMIERVGLFYDSYKDLGRKINAVCSEYNNGVIKLEDNGRSITTSARSVMKLGIKRSKGKELSVPEEQVFLSGETSEE